MEGGPHGGDLLALLHDDLLGNTTEHRVVAVAQLGDRHVDRGLMVRDHHGGKVEAHTQPGGNTFTVRLPLKPERVAAASGEDTDYLKRALLNENLWSKLLARS